MRCRMSASKPMPVPSTNERPRTAASMPFTTRICSGFALGSTPRIEPMSLSRALRRSVSRLLIGVVLFAQIAVASYACPGLKVMGSVGNGGAATAMHGVVTDTAAKPAAIVYCHCVMH